MILHNKKVMHISGMTIPPYGLHYIPRGNIGLVGISGKAKNIENGWNWNWNWSRNWSWNWKRKLNLTVQLKLKLTPTLKLTFFFMNRSLQHSVRSWRTRDMTRTKGGTAHTGHGAAQGGKVWPRPRPYHQTDGNETRKMQRPSHWCPICLKRSSA